MPATDKIATVKVETAITQNPFSEYTPEQIKLVKQTVAQDCNDIELAFFLHNARRFGLDPVAKQIYAIKRKGRMTIQTSIDGMRLIADRTKGYAPGQETEYRYEEVVIGIISKKQLVSATAYVKKLAGGEWHEVAETAHWAEYVQVFYDKENRKDKIGDMWAKMPHVMLAKCFDSETEILTTNGFEKFSQVTGRILQVTPYGLEATDAQPFSQDWTGPMVTLDSDDLNFAVTPNHDMITDEGKIEAAALYEQSRSRKTLSIPRCVMDSARGLDLSEQTLKLVGAFLADGCVTDGQTFRIAVSKPRKVEFLTALGSRVTTTLRTAGDIAHTRSGRVITTKSDKVRFSFPVAELRGLCNAANKEVNLAAIAQLSSIEARILLDAWLFFDGNKQTKTGVRRIFTSRPQHRAVIELLAVISGQAIGQWQGRTSDISVSPNWFATISDRSLIPVFRWGRAVPYPRTSKWHRGIDISPINTSGKVWCVTVPSGEIIVRRHGFSMRCGNCAEARALRRAFPAELGGLYETSEMTQAENTYDPTNTERDLSHLAPGEENRGHGKEGMKAEAKKTVPKKSSKKEATTIEGKVMPITKSAQAVAAEVNAAVGGNTTTVGTKSPQTASSAEETTSLESHTIHFMYKNIKPLVKRLAEGGERRYLAITAASDLVYYCWHESLHEHLGRAASTDNQKGEQVTCLCREKTIPKTGETVYAIESVTQIGSQPFKNNQPYNAEMEDDIASFTGQNRDESPEGETD